MGAFSDYLQDKILRLTLRGEAFSAPADVYVALFTGDPGGDGLTNEVADSGYARQATGLNWSIPALEGGGGHLSSNDNSIQFPAIVDAAITITHFAIFDAGAAGNMLYKGEVTGGGKVYQVDDIPLVLAGQANVIVGYSS